MPRELMLRVEIRRRYGDHEITFAIAEQVTVNHGQERRDHYNNLLGQLEDQINVYEHVSLPHVKLPQRSGGFSNSSGTNDSYPLEKIIVENVKGKKHIAAMGGRWAKHGVPIYKECETDLDVGLLGYGIHDFAHLNLTVTVELEGGKAKRVRSIR